MVTHYPSSKARKQHSQVSSSIPISKHKKPFPRQSRQGYKSRQVVSTKSTQHKFSNKKDVIGTSILNKSSKQPLTGSAIACDCPRRAYSPIKMASIQNSTIIGMLILLLVRWQLASAMPAPTTYHYGYDDGRRSSLLQLYDGLSIQDLIQSSQVCKAAKMPSLVCKPHRRESQLLVEDRIHEAIT